MSVSLKQIRGKRQTKRSTDYFRSLNSYQKKKKFIRQVKKCVNTVKFNFRSSFYRKVQPQKPKKKEYTTFSFQEYSFWG